MHTNNQQQLTFTLLKNAMKVRKKTYTELADYLQVSVPAVKRIFTDKDCKFSRLMQICEFLDLDFYELIKSQERHNQYPSYLPETTETALAQDSRAFGVFLLIIAYLSKGDILKVAKLSESDYYQSLRKLEKLDLIAITQNNQFTIKANLPIAWRADGALADVITTINLRYLRHCIDHETQANYTYFTKSRLMSTASVKTIERKLAEVHEAFHYYATQDQLFYESNNLSLYKLQVAYSPFVIEDVVFRK